jgi:Holliday junction resolvase
MSASTPEGKVKRKVVEVLKRHGVWYFFPANNGFGKAGIPDIIAIVRGKFVGVEVKADRTKKPTELQVRCGEEIQRAQGWWFVVYDAETLRSLEQAIEEKLYR